MVAPNENSDQKVQKQKAVRADKAKVSDAGRGSAPAGGGKRNSGSGHTDKRRRDSSGAGAGSRQQPSGRQQGRSAKADRTDSQGTSNRQGFHGENAGHDKGSRKGAERDHTRDVSKETVVRGPKERLQEILPKLRHQLSQIIARNNRILATTRPGNFGKRVAQISKRGKHISDLIARINYIEGRLRQAE